MYCIQCEEKKEDLVQGYCKKCIAKGLTKHTHAAWHKIVNRKNKEIVQLKKAILVLKGGK